MPRFAQCKENVRVASKELTPADRARRSSARTPSSATTGACSSGRPGTEPLVRVLVEAEDGELREEGLC